MELPSSLSEYVEWFERELDSVVRFWTAHSHDETNGGFWHCLSEVGEVYDTVKYGWMQARQVWMYAKLHNTLPKYCTAGVLEPAVRGGEFLIRHVRVGREKRCYFAVTEDGRPAKLQRKPYTECFYTIAMAELHRATGAPKYKLEAEEMLSQVIHWIRVDDSGLGVPKLEGAPPSEELGRPMMLLNVLSEFCGEDKKLREKYASDFEWSLQAILKHHDGHWVREHVSPEGAVLPGSMGRLTTPGHALEAGWFLLQEAQLRGNPKLQAVAIEQFIEEPYAYGLDREHGGLFYFLDVGGHSPTQLEWGMKLWWVHCEAMVASLLAYQHTREARHWHMFHEICQFTLSKFPDPEHGEWYGYLTREGKRNQTFKGGPYKGCFHVARCLLYCVQALKQLQDTFASSQTTS